ncbi:TonB family protein [Microvirga tunisiensis]|uniref:TonB family protein n=1 Tax=Pannonibacter tanglangensis TaxID=2750084 RepID=A0ABW9ZGK7_9HYPH|nr:TonB family protein [Pannonibacter sp. XCT-34]
MTARLAALPDPSASARPKPTQTKPATARPEKPKPATTRQQRTDAAQTPVTPSAAGGAGGQASATALAGGAGRIGTGEAEGNAEVSNYPGLVSRALRRALYYPPSAKRRRLTGETLVSFVVAKGGAASSIRVARSSGVPELDEAALETVRRAAPFPAIPAAARRDTWTFTIPIAFR